MIAFELTNGYNGDQYTLPVSSEETPQITLEREQEPFFRVADDIQGTFAPTSDAMLQAFLNPAGRLRIVVKDTGVPFFTGEVARTRDGIRYLPTKGIVRATIISDVSVFWNALQGGKTNSTYDGNVGGSGRPSAGRRGIKQLYAGNNTITLQTLLEQQLATFRGGPPTPYQDPFLAFGKIDLGTFATLNVRGGSLSPTGYTNYGRISELDPNTTPADLLKAIAAHYNAEFFIEPDTLTLKMRDRNAIANDIDVNIDDRVMDDQDPQILPFTVEPYDWVNILWPTTAPFAENNDSARLLKMGANLGISTAWIRFDSRQNTWTKQIYNDYKTKMADGTWFQGLLPYEAAGNLLDAVPRLNFVDFLNPKVMRSSDTSDVACFLMILQNDTDSAHLLERWKWAFLQQKGVIANFKGTDFRVGDRWQTRGKLGLGYGGVRIKAATIDPVKEQSQVELTTVAPQVS